MIKGRVLLYLLGAVQVAGTLAILADIVAQTTSTKDAFVGLVLTAIMAASAHNTLCAAMDRTPSDRAGGSAGGDGA